jgi:hypothetical protein
VLREPKLLDVARVRVDEHDYAVVVVIERSRCV